MAVGFVAAVPTSTEIHEQRERSTSTEREWAVHLTDHEKEGSPSAQAPAFEIQYGTEYQRRKTRASIMLKDQPPQDWQSSSAQPPGMG
jgi:hypothetical protein